MRTLLKVINRDQAPKRIKEVIAHGKSNYDIRGKLHFRAVKSQHYKLRFKIVEVYDAKTMELKTCLT